MFIRHLAIALVACTVCTGCDTVAKLVTALADSETRPPAWDKPTGSYHPDRLRKGYTPPK